MALLFQSAAIAENLHDITGSALLAGELLARARQRASIESTSGTLADLAGFCAPADRVGFDQKLSAWRANLAADPMVRDAVSPDYPARLGAFMAARSTFISGLMQAAG